MSKQDKVFVRYNNFDEGPPPGRGRNEKKPYEKKKYAEKHVKNRQAFKHIYDSFEPINKLPAPIQELLKRYPKFFNKESKVPEKQSNQILNDSLILFGRKFFQGLKQPRRQPEPMISSSDPDWNTDDDVDCDMESKQISSDVIDKVKRDLKGKPINRLSNYKPHEKKFLEDYYRQKRQKEEEEKNEVENKASQQVKKEEVSPAAPQSLQTKKENSPPLDEYSKNKLIWSDHQERQLNTFVNMGFMTKIEENEDQMPVEVIEDDDMFNDDDSNKENNSSNKSSSSSEQEDDIFGDQTPTTTVKTKQEPAEPKIESEKKVTQGTVMINDHLFSDIAQSIGLMPARCSWYIRNEYNTKYKVSSDYMDAYYRKQKMYELFPEISLNHSQFVNNEKVETAQGLTILKDINSRKTNYQYRPKYHYKQKPTHRKK